MSLHVTIHLRMTTILNTIQLETLMAKTEAFRHLELMYWWSAFCWLMHIFNEDRLYIRLHLAL